MSPETQQNLLCTYKELFTYTINCCQPMSDTVCSIYHMSCGTACSAGWNVIWHNMAALQHQPASSHIINSKL